MRLRGPEVTGHEFIPRRHARDGDNLSPALEWSGVPDGTAELLLMCEDPDAPAGSFLHWLVTGVDPSSTGVAEGRVPPGGRQWPNDYGETGWGGPQPPRGHGPHRYVFRLYALGGPVRLPARPTVADVHRLVDPAALSGDSITGRYQR